MVTNSTLPACHSDRNFATEESGVESAVGGESRQGSNIDVPQLSPQRVDFSVVLLLSK